MSKTFEDKTGADVTVTFNEDGQSYDIAVADGTVAGHAYFLTGPDAETERIFHHTVVDGYVGKGGPGQNADGMGRLPAPRLPDVTIRPRKNPPPQVQGGPEG